MPMIQTRRRFISSVALAGAAGLLHAPRVAAAEGDLETTTIRLQKIGGVCVAPVYAAEELLRNEGFTDIRYVAMPNPVAVIEAVAHGEIDFGFNYTINYVPAIDAGKSITLLAGVHVGCFEAFARDGIRTIGDLKGKSVGVQSLGSTGNLLVRMMAAQVGLDPDKDIHWVTDPSAKPIDLFVQGKIDAFLGLPPEPQDLRARQIGNVIVNSAVDRPWSQYFCCLVSGNPAYVRNHPVATKRALRAILKATDLCEQPVRRRKTARRWRLHSALRVCSAGAP
jgi:NitT/TauT family transport system substrate-binding protein